MLSFAWNCVDLVPENGLESRIKTLYPPHTTMYAMGLVAFVGFIGFLSFLALLVTNGIVVHDVRASRRISFQLRIPRRVQRAPARETLLTTPNPVLKD